VSRLTPEGIECAARGGRTEEMTGSDRVDARTQNLLQVGANAGEKIVQ